MSNDVDKYLPSFNEIYERFCKNAVDGGFYVTAKNLPEGGKLITASLVFVAKKRVRSERIEPLSDEELEREIECAKKDHLASILAACGLMPGRG